MTDHEIDTGIILDAVLEVTDKGPVLHTDEGPVFLQDIIGKYDKQEIRFTCVSLGSIEILENLIKNLS